MEAAVEVQRIPVTNDMDIVTTRMEAREIARKMGFGIVDQARIATAVSELTRNIVLYAGEGTVTIHPIVSGERSGIEVICEDQGPGIEDVDSVMRGDYQTPKGVGKGLPGARRLMDELEIETALGQGTRVTVRKWLR